MTTRVPVKLASGDSPQSDEQVHDLLAACVSPHGIALGIREMDVLNDWLGLRCAECRRLFDLDVATFETRERT